MMYSLTVHRPLESLISDGMQSSAVLAYKHCGTLSDNQDFMSQWEAKNAISVHAIASFPSIVHARTVSTLVKIIS